MAAIDEGDDEGIREPLSSCIRIVHEAEPPEVDLGHLAGFGFGHADGRLRRNADLGCDEPVEGRVSCFTTEPHELEVDLRERQVFVLHPFLDLLLVREERLALRRGRTGKTGVELCEDLGGDRFEVAGTFRRKAFFGGKVEILLHRVPAHARCPGDRSDPVALLLPSQDIHNVDHHILLSRHTVLRVSYLLEESMAQTYPDGALLSVGGSISMKNSTPGGSKILKKGGGPISRKNRPLVDHVS